MTSPVPTTDPLFPDRWLGVAESICERYYAEFPDHDQRYGGRGRAYCAHDNAYLVAWLVDALGPAGPASFATNVDWLRGLLEARGFPLDAFARNLDLVGDAVIALRPADEDRIRATVVRAATAAAG
jgi:hypothetical protein